MKTRKQLVEEIATDIRTFRKIGGRVTLASIMMDICQGRRMELFNEFDNISSPRDGLKLLEEIITESEE